MAMMSVLLRLFKTKPVGLSPVEVDLRVPALPPLSWAAEVALWHRLLLDLGQSPIFVRECACAVTKVHPAGYGAFDPLDPMTGATLAPVSLKMTRVRLLWQDHLWNPESRQWAPSDSLAIASPTWTMVHQLAFPDKNTDPLPDRLMDALGTVCPETARMVGLHGNKHPLRRLSRRQAKAYRCPRDLARLHGSARQWLEEARTALEPLIRARHEKAALEKILPTEASPVRPRRI